MGIDTPDDFLTDYAGAPSVPTHWRVRKRSAEK